MSGVRAHDAELLALGLTLPAFVQGSKVIASLPSLGLLYLARRLYGRRPSTHSGERCEEEPSTPLAISQRLRRLFVAPYIDYVG